MTRVLPILACTLLLFASCRGGRNGTGDRNDSIARQETMNHPGHKEHKVTYTNTTYFFDVVGDRSLDTLMVCNNESNPSVREIYLNRKGTPEKIISILPWRDSTFVLTDPQVEVIYLEANGIQTGDKGFRIVIRNTDCFPDCLFIDLYHDDNEWILQRYYLLNTEISPYYNMKPFIKCIEVDQPLADRIGYDLECDPNWDLSFGLVPEMEEWQ
jgi:hypothetical protein